MNYQSEYSIGSHRIVSGAKDAIATDPRGLIFIFEPPSPHFSYFMGIDAAQGRSGWSRYSRDEDDDSDNGAIEIIRAGRGREGQPNFIPARQVAEFAAPCDPYDLAVVANLMGRMYGGSNEDGMALAIIEVYPGPGGATQHEMMSKYGYFNMFRGGRTSDLGGSTGARSFDYGWYSNKQSMQHLWTKGLATMHKGELVFKSPYLVEEMAGCEMDLVKLRGRAAGDGHDDRATAILMALWAMNRWDFDATPETKVEQGPVKNWQASDITADAMREQWNDIVGRLME